MMKLHRQLLSLMLGIASVLGIAPSAAAAATPARRAAPAKASPGNASLARVIDRILQAPEVARAHWGISVIDPDGRSIYKLNEGQSFEPASNAKLFTTATAFAVFSSDARFETRVVSRGTLDAEGTLHGDVVLEGTGDPSISGREWPYSGKTARPNPPLGALEELADQIAKGGRVHKVAGGVIGSDSWFPLERYGSGWGWDDLQWEYGAPVTALAVNDNVVYLDLMPGPKAGDPIAASWNPPFPYYALQMTALTGPSGPKPHLGIDRQPGSKVVRLFGNLPVDSKGVHLALAIEDPAEFAALAFRQMLMNRGILVAGGGSAQHALPMATNEFLEESRLPLPAQLPTGIPLAGFMAADRASAPAEVLATRRSPPLLQDLTVINKVSQNLHAELILHDLGKAVLNDGSTAAGARVVRQFLLRAGVDPGDFLFYDGSGLSSQDLITPRAATTLLAYAARQPWGEAFRAVLPVAGVDGSLAGRFTQSPVRGKLLAKTGTLAETNALSGYLTVRSGRTLIVSVLCNDHEPVSDASHVAADKIIEAIYAAE